MHSKIRKTGTIQNLDKEGYIINNLSLDNLQQEYKIILNEVLKFYLQHFSEKIHSIYLRGSVAKGEAIHNISDIDTIAISFDDIAKESLEIRTPFRQEMDIKYPYLNGIEMHFEKLDNVMSTKKIQFLFKTQCICINGTDIREKIPKFGIGKWAYAHSKNLKKDIENATQRLKKEPLNERREQTCSWIMKRMIRVGFEIVMKKEQCFTRDLYPCYELFSKHYPEKESQMMKALELAIFPVADIDSILEIVNSLDSLLITEVGKIV